MLTYDFILLSWRRPGNISACIAAALGQTVPPRRVVVWHNAPSYVLVKGAEHIVCDYNAGCRPRHAIGQLSTADVVIFADDDVLLADPRVAAALLAAVKRHPESVVGVAGRRLARADGNLYSDDAVECASWKRTDERANTPEGDQAVSVVKGKVHAIRRSLLPLAFVHDLPAEIAGEDDIVLSAECQMATGAPSWLAGGIEHAWIRDLPDTDQVGNEFRKDHFARRSATCRHMVELGWDPMLWQETSDTK